MGTTTTRTLVRKSIQQIPRGELDEPEFLQKSKTRERNLTPKATKRTTRMTYMTAWEAGDEVEVRWEDGIWYQATILEARSDSKYHIKFRLDAIEEVHSPKNIRAIADEESSHTERSSSDEESY